MRRILELEERLFKAGEQLGPNNCVILSTEYELLKCYSQLEPELSRTMRQRIVQMCLHILPVNIICIFGFEAANDTRSSRWLLRMKKKIFKGKKWFSFLFLFFCSLIFQVIRTLDPGPSKLKGFVLEKFVVSYMHVTKADYAAQIINRKQFNLRVAIAMKALNEAMQCLRIEVLSES